MWPLADQILEFVDLHGPYNAQMIFQEFISRNYKLDPIMTEFNQLLRSKALLELPRSDDAELPLYTTASWEKLWLAYLRKIENDGIFKRQSNC